MKVGSSIYGGKGFCILFRENGLVIGNGGFRKDKGKGDYTCFTGAKGSVIDYVLVDFPLAMCVRNVEVLPFVGSDHFPVLIEILQKLPTNVLPTQHRRNFQKKEFLKRVLSKL